MLGAHPALAPILAAIALTACGGERESTRAAEAPAKPRAADAEPADTTLYLAGDGELTVVDVEARTTRVVPLAELSPGDPPYRIVRAGDKLVLYNRDAAYTVDLELKERPRRLAKAWFFMPSALPNRVWLAVLDPTSPETVRALAAVREVAVDGRVTVPDVAPPGGRWPVAAVADGLVFEGQRGLEIWIPPPDRSSGCSRVKPPAPGTATACPGAAGSLEGFTSRMCGRGRRWSPPRPPASRASTVEARRSPRTAACSRCRSRPTPHPSRRARSPSSMSSEAA
jgi:hypothetical protein